MKKQQRRAAVLGILAIAVASEALAGPPVPLVPREPTGYSSIEQRYVYAQPDEGEFGFDLNLGMGYPTEVVLAEPSMCEGSGTVKFKYSKSRNEVELIAKFKGLPYRMSYTRPVDVSTPYNQFPVSVEDGIWQIWFVGRMFNFDTTFYYDGLTLQLIGNEHDVPNPPAGAIPVLLPTLHMIASPLFEGNRGGNANIKFKFRYDSILDEQGKGGVYFALAPSNLCKPDEYTPYYTQGGLPVEKAFSFDDVLESIWSGHGMAIATSLEPQVKPEYLLSRDNTMIGWANMYPGAITPGYVIEDIRGTLAVRTTCETSILRDYPKAHYNLCAGQ